MAFFRSAAERLYRRLLGLYPGEFRDEWGGEMSSLFRDRSREESLPALVAGVVVDAFRTAPREHLSLWRRDGCHALRLLARNPAPTVVAMLSLGLGTGVASAVFGLADALLFRPLPVTRPQDLLALRGIEAGPLPGGGDAAFSWPDYRDYRSRVQSFGGLLAGQFTTVSFAPRAGVPPELRFGMLVSGDFFSVLGVAPALGRGFQSAEESPETAAVVVLSHGLWRSALAGDPEVVGRPVRLNGREFTVVGVAPETFTGLDPFVRPAFYVPIPADALLSGETGRRRLEQRDDRWLEVKGRLRPGVTRTAAQAELERIATDLAAEHPATNRARGVLARTEREARRESSPSDSALAAMLFTLAGLVSLIACANVASLLLGQARARSHEMAVRQALGASPARLLRQLLTESAVLAAAGGAVGVVVAAAGVDFLGRIPLSTDVPMQLDVRVDGRLLGFNLVAAAVSVFAFGLAPAVQAARTRSALELTARARRAARWRPWARQGLVVGQLALSLVLLVLTTVLVRGFARSVDRETGYRRDHLLLAPVDTSVLHYSPEATERFYRELVSRARGLTGVTGAALSYAIPLGNRQQTVTFVPEGSEPPDGRTAPSCFATSVDPSYFETLGVPLLAGRGFRDTDTAHAPSVVVVNERLARTYWPGRDAVGRRIRLGVAGPWAEVVGVARTHKYVWTGEAEAPYLYLPLGQAPREQMTLLLSTAGDPVALAPALREIVRSLDPDLPLGNVRPLSDHLAAKAGGDRHLARTVGLLGAIGLLLSLTGLYALVAHSVEARRREIGVRMALGASRPAVLRLVLGQALGVGLVGVAAGLAASLLAARGIAAVVHGVDSRDLVAFGALPPLLLIVAVAAALGPAARATRVDPSRTLRAE